MLMDLFHALESCGLDHGGLGPAGASLAPSGALLAVASLLFILSRAALGMHWPSDLFVGALLGSAIGFTGYQLQKRTTAR